MKRFIRTSIKGILACPHCQAVVNINNLKPRASSSSVCKIEADCLSTDCGKTACLDDGFTRPKQANTPTTNPDQGAPKKRKNKNQ